MAHPDDTPAQAAFIENEYDRLRYCTELGLCVFDSGQTPPEHASASAAQGTLMPTICHHGRLLWSTQASRWLTVSEMLVGMGFPIMPPFGLAMFSSNLKCGPAICHQGQVVPYHSRCTNGRGAVSRPCMQSVLDLVFK